MYRRKIEFKDTIRKCCDTKNVGKHNEQQLLYHRHCYDMRPRIYIYMHMCSDKNSCSKSGAEKSYSKNRAVELVQKSREKCRDNNGTNRVP